LKSLIAGLPPGQEFSIRSKERNIRDVGTERTFIQRIDPWEVKMGSTKKKTNFVGRAVHEMGETRR